ncbi:MAG: NAD(P)/FAD-dependent oxidoreductase, partial [Bacteroidota bacterium]
MRGEGLRIALVDRYRFPRDKVCGDAVGGRVRRVLSSLDPGLAARFDELPLATVAGGWRLVAPSGRDVVAYFKTPGLVCAREHFDDFLFREAASTHGVDVMTGSAAVDISVEDKQVNVSFQDKQIASTLLIACDGANSIAARKIFSRKVDTQYHSGAVRAYFRNVQGTSGSQLLEIHLIKGRLPGYFWIFPLPDDRCNVGFGMLTRDLSSRRVDLRSSFSDI